MGWIFGYGSLMWLPGFEHGERRPARLKGYHREFCMVSTRNRGTEATPGLVLSLCPGGELVGMAYAYDPAREAEVFKYLDEREGLHRAHERCIVPISFVPGPEPRQAPDAHPVPGGAPSVPCWTYLPVLTAPNFRATMPLSERAELVARGSGKIGSSYEYLRLLIEEMDKLGEHDAALDALFAAAQSVNPGLAAAGK